MLNNGYISCPDETILQITSSVLRVPIKAIVGRWRPHEVVLARHASIFVYWKQHKYSLKSIGLLHGGRDHSTVMNARDRIFDGIDTKERINKDGSGPLISEIIEQIEREFYLKKPVANVEVEL